MNEKTVTISQAKNIKANGSKSLIRINEEKY